VIKIVVEDDFNHVQQRIEPLLLPYYLTKKRFIMEATKSNLSKPILVKLAKVLLKTQEEIDDLAVQFSLGQAEAVDKFEEIKKSAKATFQDLKNTLILKVGEDNVHKLRGQLDDLEVQFALGKSETSEFYEEQRKKIAYALHNVETELKANENFAKMRTAFATEIERLKLNLAVLKKQFDTQKVDVGHQFKEKLKEARHETESLLSKAEDKWDDVKEKYEDFSDEIKEASQHVKKAIDVL
jgi:ribosomal protein L29